MPAESSFSRRFRTGQVLFSKRRLPAQAAMAPFGGVCSGDLLVLRRTTTSCCPRAAVSRPVRGVHASRRADVSAGSLSAADEMEGSRPFRAVSSPLDRQRRMVALLEAATRMRSLPSRRLRLRVDWRAPHGVPSCSSVSSRGRHACETRRRPDTQSVRARRSRRLHGEYPIVGMGQMVDGRMTISWAGYVSLTSDELPRTVSVPTTSSSIAPTASTTSGGSRSMSSMTTSCFASYLSGSRPAPGRCAGSLLLRVPCARRASAVSADSSAWQAKRTSIRRTSISSCLFPHVCEQQRRFIDRAEEMQARAGALLERFDASRTLLTALIEHELATTSDVQGGGGGGGGGDEQNSVENFLRDRLARGEHGRVPWKFISGVELDRSEEDVLVVGEAREGACAV